VALHAGHIPLVIGGDCTIELGTLSGLLRRHTDIALLYFDGGVDLRTPADNPTGMLDSMGVAHMLAAPGAADALSHIGPRFPLMTDDRIVLFGYTPNQQGPEHVALTHYSMPRYTGEQVHDQPEATASEARTHVEQLAEHFVIHFDVDVIDFMNFPITDVP
jgi:arginase